MSRSFSLLLVFVISAIGCFAQIRSDKDLVGKWEGGGMKLQFFSDRHISIIGRGGQLPMGSFKSDYMQNPAIVMISISDHGQTLTYKVKLQFIDNDNILVEYLSGDSADAFEKGRQVRLKKIK